MIILFYMCHQKFSKLFGFAPGTERVVSINMTRMLYIDPA